MAKRFVALDGMRGIAAVAVLLHHVGALAHQPWLSPYGYLAVDLFFLISGVVLARAYEKLFARDLGPMEYILETRVLRMYPMILLGAVLGLISALIGARASSSPGFDFARLLILFPSLQGKDLFVLNTVMWSLMLELAINAVHAFVYPVLSKRLLITVVVVSALAMIYTAWIYYGLNAGWDRATGLGGIARVSFSFAGGVLVYRLYAAGRLPKIHVPFGIAAALMVAAMIVPLPSVKHHLPMLHDLLAAFVVFPLAVVTGMQIELKGRLEQCGKILSELSYPLYAIQFPLIHIAIWYAGPSATGATFRWGFWGTFCLAVIVLAWIIDRKIEEPIQKWRKSIFPARKPPTA